MSQAQAASDQAQFTPMLSALLALLDETTIPEMQARKRNLDLEEGTNVSAKRTNVARAISAAGDSSSPQPTPSQPSVQSRCQSISVPDGTLSNCGRWYTVEDGPFKGIYRFKKDEAYVLQCSKKTRRMFEQQVSRSMV